MSKTFTVLVHRICCLENFLAAARAAMRGKLSTSAAARFHACRAGKGTHAGVRRCGGFARRFPFVLKCDIRRYFPSIDHHVLRERIARTVADPDVMRLIDLILASHEDSRPQESAAASRVIKSPARRAGCAAARSAASGSASAPPTATTTGRPTRTTTWGSASPGP